MVRAGPAAAIAGFLVVVASCGGDAFSGGGGATDDGGGHDALSDGAPNDAPPADVNGEPPPSCMGGDYACVPAVPSGWDGPLEVYSGTAAPPACTTGFAQGIGAYDLLQAAAPTCGCSCGPSAITCAPPKLEFSNSLTCGTALPCANEVLQPGVCTTLDESSKCVGATGIDMTPVDGATTMGSCAPQPTRDIPAYTWGLQARGCLSTITPAQVDCAGGQICAPKSEPGFGPKLCVSRAGDWTCPGGGYGVKHLFYTSVNDTRDCTACTCTPPSGGSCSFSITEYNSSNKTCLGNTITYVSGDKCAGTLQPGDWRLTMTQTAGTCGASTSTATGTATVSGPVTVCCPL